MKELLLLVLLPLILANCLHMVIVKLNLFAFLQIPIAAKKFGAHKTLRGFLILPVLNGIILFGFNSLGFVATPYPFQLGFLLGLSYLIAELPNSFLKRKMGIAAGETASKYRWIFTLLDKSDSAFGVVLTYWIFSGIPVYQALLLFACCSFTHFVFSWLLLQVKLKKSF